jgi:hypothetical protein
LHLKLKLQLNGWLGASTMAAVQLKANETQLIFNRSQ